MIGGSHVYLTQREVAEIVGVTPRTIRVWTRDAAHGFPRPCRYIGQRPKWRRSDIIAGMEPQRESA